MSHMRWKGRREGRKERGKEGKKEPSKQGGRQASWHFDGNFVSDSKHILH